MKCVFLADASNRGKTTSIKMAANKFLQNKSSAITNVSPKDFANAQGDSRVVITYMSADNTKRVAFCSGGDYSDVVADNIKFAVDNNCDILVSASRSKGRCFDEIFKFLQQPGNAGVLVKAIDFWKGNDPIYDNANNHAALAELTANHLLAVVDYIS